MAIDAASADADALAGALELSARPKREVHLTQKVKAAVTRARSSTLPELRKTAERAEARAALGVRALEIPNELLCPIGRELFENPVMAADGHNYERKHIERWLQQANTSPKTNEEFAHQHLTQNHEMRARCLEWKEMREKARAGKGTGAGTGRKNLRKKREGERGGGRRLSAEGVVKKTAPIVQKKSISSLSDAFPSDLTLRYIAKHHVFTFWVSGAVQMLFMFHAPVSSKAFLYFDCTRLGARSFCVQTTTLSAGVPSGSRFCPSP